MKLALKLVIGIAAVMIFSIAVLSFQSGLLKQSSSYIPEPTEIVAMTVEEGGLYKFPWVPAEATCDLLSSGCFFVRESDKDGVLIGYELFKIQAGKIVPLEWERNMTIPREGTISELFIISEGDKTNEFWIYAKLTKSDSQLSEISFMKYPASSTGNADIYREIDVNFPNNSIKDTYTVDSKEMVTLIASTSIDYITPGATITQVLLNGEEIRFPYQNIMNLNLPSGRYEVTVLINLPRSKDLALTPVYEGRNMSLPKQTDLRINGASNLSVSLSTFGIPDDAWYNTDIVLASEPKPIREEKDELSLTMQFGSEVKSLKFKPMFYYNGFRFPVLPNLSLND